MITQTSSESILCLAPICIDGAGCGKDATGYYCGYKAACVMVTDGKTACTETVVADANAAKCTCKCSLVTTRAPGKCVLRINVFHSAFRSKSVSCC